MTDYVNTNAGDFLQPHEALRVTFAEDPSFLVPDDIASANLAFDIDHLISDMESGGVYTVVPISDPTVAPGALAVTVDFMVPGAASVTVSRILSELERGLFGPFQFLHQTRIARVEKLRAAGSAGPTGGVARGDASGAVASQFADTALGRTLGRVFGTAAIGLLVVGAGVLLVMYGPEIKTALSSVKRRRAA